MILIFVEGEFPTVKGYGITTKFTLTSLHQLGVEAKVISARHTKNEVIDYDNQIFLIDNLIVRFLRKLAHRGDRIVNKIAWKSATCLGMYLTRKKVHTLSPEVIWVRDNLPSKTWLNCSNLQKIVIELHHMPKKSLVKKLQKQESEKFVLAPISLSILEAVAETGLKNKVIYSPMGVDIHEESNDAFFQESQGFQRIQSDPIRIAYFGKLFPGGYSKGYEDLLDLATHHSNLGFPSQVWIVGALPNENAILLEAINSRGLVHERVKSVGHVPHRRALQLMNEVDILVLPNVKNWKYFGSPLKALEYAATGIPILAADTRINRDVFDDNFQPFWYHTDSVESMHEKILEILSITETSRYAMESINFARKRTWIARTKKILEFVS